MPAPGLEKALFNEISLLIEQSKQHVVSQANSTLTLLFWNVGKRINSYVLQHQRAQYGKQIVGTLSRQLVNQHGRNFEEKNLRRMLQFADLFPDVQKVVTLSRHLSWSHFLVLLPLKESPRCLFYAHKAINENLGVRALRKQITQKTYERTAIANTQLPEISHQLSNSFKDPYLLDFLKLPASYLESDW